MAANPERDVTVLIVEDEPHTLSYMEQILRGTYRHVVTAGDAEEALALIGRQSVDVVITDIYMPRMNGIKLMETVRRESPRIVFILVTGKADVQQAVEAVKAGAYDYLAKPVDADAFLLTVRRAAEKVKLETDNQRLRAELRNMSAAEKLVGTSAAMREILERLQVIKDADSNVLIQGETGTGKELIARYIHFESKRGGGPFVKLNCGAIPKDLLESELFGHEKGSFTGAISQRIGRFEMADQGTILLDEIGDMPMELQIKLLSVIQDRVIERIGGTKPIPVDVRVLAATHQDLEAAIREKRFREDLYYRLNVLNVRVPPLREHREDIPVLVEYFLKQYGSRMGKRMTGVEPAAMQLLMQHDYPGNVRELENVVERAVVLCRGERIGVEDLPETVGAGRREPEWIEVAPGTPLATVERMCLLETLKMVGGNKRKAAELLGISEKSVYNKLQRYGLSVGAGKT
jgi:two-component system NtrC family response regulator/two-component system response regulator HydG